MPNQKNRKKIANKNKTSSSVKREMIYKEEGQDQEYAWVTKSLGSCRFTCLGLDGVSRLCKVRGTLIKRKIYVNPDDLVLISLRDYQDKVGDIFHVYNRDEITHLKQIGHIQKEQANIIDNTNDLKQTESDFDFESI